MRKFLIILLNILIFAAASILLSGTEKNGDLILRIIYSVALVKAGFNITKTLKNE
ncbi:hypothetical protein [Peptoniphilus grossensis]|uniref:hypothetical protein n=1 Tax=Peptoniphilus grossensis TaxID=1465756 RepID=UPI00030459D8|nr:hypothetical protein [Peptoniphilus grossensis]